MLLYWRIKLKSSILRFITLHYPVVVMMGGVVVFLFKGASHLLRLYSYINEYQ